MDVWIMCGRRSGGAGAAQLHSAGVPALRGKVSHLCNNAGAPSFLQLLRTEKDIRHLRARRVRQLNKLSERRHGAVAAWRTSKMKDNLRKENVMRPQTQRGASPEQERAVGTATARGRALLPLLLDVSSWMSE